MDMADTGTKTRTKNPTPDPGCTTSARAGHGVDRAAGLARPTLKKVTKYLSYVLRHGPDTIGVAMDRNGWVDVDTLIERSADHRPLTKAVIDLVVASDAKQRFAFSSDRRRIRAVNGHSVPVDLELEPLQPPASLFHGTAVYNVAAILRDGLLPIGRTYVHLSDDHRSAAAIGGRLSCPKVLTIDSAAMAADGYVFHRSENGIWLSGPVPPKYLTAVD